IYPGGRWNLYLSKRRERRSAHPTPRRGGRRDLGIQSPCTKHVSRIATQIAYPMSEDVQIKMNNSAKYKGKDRWEWSVWIDGPAERLDEIAYVEYILHPTFTEPIRRVEDRGSQFRLNSRGWGEFMVHANVATHTGE